MGTICSRPAAACAEQRVANPNTDESRPLPGPSAVPAKATSQTNARPVTAWESLCLDAFAVALLRARKGKQWYVSTLELQLASFELCRACRSVPSLHVHVTDESPLTLWVPREEALHQHQPRRPRQHVPSKAASCCSRAVCLARTPSSRVPAVPAVRLTWKLTGRTLVESGAMAEWRDLEDLRLEGDWSWSDLGSASSSSSGARELVFGMRTKPPRRGVKWPPNLRHLSVGRDVDQPVTRRRRRASRPVEAGIDEPITGVVWPTSMERLSFGSGFNQSITGIEWPASLKQLLFGPDFDQPIADVVWPECVRQLSFGGFNQPITEVMWPVSLHQLSFKRDFNQPIAGIVWPSFLRQLSFGEHFDQPLDGVVWPPSLRHLILGKNFDQPVAGIEWPDSLQHMSFGPRFNQSVAEVVWPIFLEKLEFGRTFNQPIAEVEWPESLQQLSFGNVFNQPVAGVLWPASLRRLSFGHQFDQTVTGICWPAGLQSVTRDRISLLADG